jgi:ParB family chromosome partitioning protein
MLELALVENLQREDLNAIDRAEAYRGLCTKFDLKPEQVAERVGEDRTTVVNYMRLLELSKPIRRLVAQGRLGMGHARCLLGIKDEDRRERLAGSASQNELSVRALEEIVRREKTRTGEAAEAASQRTQLRSAHLTDLESKFEQAVKTKVTIHEGRGKGTGRITIEYYSLDDFDRIAALLGVATE